jgi:hypothetical protein
VVGTGATPKRRDNGNAATRVDVTTTYMGDEEMERGDEMGRRQREDDEGEMRRRGEQQRETQAQTTVVV